MIFSAGRDNRFGHPAPVVVARYRAPGAAMFSTAEDGAVILDTDGQSVEMRGWSGKGSTGSTSVSLKHAELLITAPVGDDHEDTKTHEGHERRNGHVLEERPLR